MAAKGFVRTPTGAIGKNTAATMQRLAGQVAARPAPAPTAPVGAAAAPPTAAAAPRVGSGFVPDSIYNNQVDFAARVAGQDRGQLDDEERATKHEFGIDDPTNPFSRQALMKQMWMRKGRSTTNSMASRGQGYAGVHQSSLNFNRRGEEQDQAAMIAEYRSRLGDIATRRTAIDRQEEEARLRSQEEWIGRQGPADYDTATPAAAAAPAAAAKPQTAAQKAAAYKDPTRKRNGQTEYRHPNGSWHTRPWRGY